MSVRLPSRSALLVATSALCFACGNSAERDGTSPDASSPGSDNSGSETSEPGGPKDAGRRTDASAQHADAGQGADAGPNGNDAEPPAPSLWLPEHDEDMPTLFSAFGIYPAAPDLEHVSPLVFVYEPRFPLWSNGSAKYRAVATPGASLDTPAPMPGEFSLGTVFFKTFTFDNPDSGAQLPVETRLMRLGEEGWEFYRYTWNADGTEATLNVSRVQQYAPAAFEGESFSHEIPNENDCKRCHEAADDPILGYREVQLTDEPIDAPDELTAEVMGYALGNCVHCHNGLDSDANSFDMHPDVFLENLLDRPTEGSASGTGIRVVPGAPDESFLFRALQGGNEEEEVQAMPPLGVQLRDEKGIRLFRDWIEQL